MLKNGLVYKVVHVGGIGDDSNVAVFEVKNPNLDYAAVYVVKLVWGCPGYSIYIMDVGAGMWVALPENVRLEMYKITENVLQIGDFTTHKKYDADLLKFLEPAFEYVFNEVLISEAPVW